MPSRGFTKQDEMLVEYLINTGMAKNIAKTLVFLKKKNETTSVEIETSTALRQPEVSIAMQDLRRRKWVVKRDIKKEGKGRPVHSYRLALPFESIIKQIEDEEARRIQKIELNLKSLRDYSSR
ncbi:MAG: ArsR family transcriptional regulator [Candidatus Thermoplasmatota archaeon]|jgi:predicted transcriptional regulator|nr:ArsR family transcriptional regulator [Candidatus Sysuiplasma jiujiangense]MBX8639134.1 ArsR family transcriptional regulator [Candidatus Sysuiplasma jiujiangense]MBX8641467.1 ArsR family transcriptional regulator [Candidatus Sysuiplasma jiujiangense]MCL5254294.1 ArsR family transcriptional regulator [Candidatus Thermoplasmatota archaeon]MCL5678018.1 ArsR family transcriptional regulator [Candidatus Thermoplasmatota archaeon]